MTQLTNTLDLDGDDCSDLALDIEKVFDFKFAAGESVRSVGDLFEILKGRFAAGYDANRRCATAMTFYRLRRALPDDRRDITPSTLLADLVHGSPKAWLTHLSKQSGLSMPFRVLTWVGNVGFAFVGISFLLLIPLSIFHLSYTWFAALFVLGVALIWVDPCRLPRDCRTFGDLVRQVASRNFGDLAKQGAHVGDSEIWTALVDILAETSRFPRQDIGPDTALARNARKAA